MLGRLKGKREGSQVLQGHRASPGLPAPRLLLARENESSHSFERCAQAPDTYCCMKPLTNIEFVTWKEDVIRHRTKKSNWPSGEDGALQTWY